MKKVASYQNKGTVQLLQRPINGWFMQALNTTLVLVRQYCIHIQTSDRGSIKIFAEISAEEV